MRLVYETGKDVVRKSGALIRTGARDCEVLPGDRVQDFRDEWHMVMSVEKPRHEASTGRVYTRETDANGVVAVDAMLRSFFPSVIDAYWTKP